MGVFWNIGISFWILRCFTYLWIVILPLSPKRFVLFSFSDPNLGPVWRKVFFSCHFVFPSLACLLWKFGGRWRKLKVWVSSSVISGLRKRYFTQLDLFTTIWFFEVNAEFFFSLSGQWKWEHDFFFFLFGHLWKFDLGWKINDRVYLNRCTPDKQTRNVCCNKRYAFFSPKKEFL